MLLPTHGPGMKPLIGTRRQRLKSNRGVSRTRKKNRLRVNPGRKELPPPCRLPMPSSAAWEWLRLQSRQLFQKQCRAELNAVVQQVADQVQVADVNGSREVRITLKESILPDTEIRLVQESGRLQVRFVSNTPESLDRIASHQRVLQAALNQKLPGRDVVVSVQTNVDSSSDNPDGRSRGQYEPLPDEDDERSVTPTT